MRRVGEAVRPAAGSLLLAGVLLLAGSIGVYRAAQESSLWTDETYSLQLAQHPPAEITALAVADAHPPGYYHLLHGWIQLRDRLAIPVAPLVWARLLNTLVGLLVPVAGWRLGVAHGDRRLALALAASLAVAAMPAVFAQDLRGYGVAVPAVFAAYVIVANGREAVARPWRREAGAATALAALAVAAFWTHLLSLLLVGLLWALLVAPSLLDRARRRWALVTTASLLLAGASFAPWLTHLGRQLEVLASGDASWKTPASGSSLLSVFAFWVPAGRLGSPLDPGNQGPLLLALVATGLLVGSAVWPPRRRRSARERVGLLFLAAAVLFVTILWLAARLELAAVFHGPRYPVMIAPLWAAGWLLLAWPATGVSPSRHPAALAVLAWLAMSLAAQATLVRRQGHAGLRNWMRQGEAAARLPPRGADLYVVPYALAKYHRQALGGFALKPLRELACAVRSDAPLSAPVLNLSAWPGLLRGPEAIATLAIDRGWLFASRETLTFPEPLGYYQVTRLATPLPDAARAYCATGFSSAQERATSGATSRALPEDQLGPGWSYLELQPPDRTYRWATSARTRVRFDRPVPPGPYRLVVTGYREPRPSSVVEVTLTVASGQSTVVRLPPGDFTLEHAGVNRGATADFWVEIGHPVWRPGGDEKRSRLSFAFFGGWLAAS